MAFQDLLQPSIMKVKYWFLFLFLFSPGDDTASMTRQRWRQRGWCDPGLWLRIPPLGGVRVPAQGEHHPLHYHGHVSAPGVGEVRERGPAVWLGAVPLTPGHAIPGLILASNDVYFIVENRYCEWGPSRDHWTDPHPASFLLIIDLTLSQPGLVDCLASKDVELASHYSGLGPRPPKSKTGPDLTPGSTLQAEHGPGC